MGRKRLDEKRRALSIHLTPQADDWLRARPSLSAGRAASQCVDLVRCVYAADVEALEADGHTESIAALAARLTQGR